MASDHGLDLTRRTSRPDQGMKIQTATTDRLIGRYSQVNLDADNVEAQGYASMANGMRSYALRIAAELARRGYKGF